MPHNDVREVNFRVGDIILTITPISFTVIAVSVLWTLFDAKWFWLVFVLQQHYFKSIQIKETPFTQYSVYRHKE